MTVWKRRMCVTAMSWKWFLLICLVPFITAYQGQQNIELGIKFNRTNGELECNGRPQFTYKEGFNIFMILSNIIDIHSARCHAGNNSRQTLLLTEFTKQNSFTWRSEIRHASYGRITCDFHIDFDPATRNKHVICSFNIVVKYLESFKAYANGNLLENDKDKKDWDVDAQAYYYFRPNELVNIKCTKPTKERGTLQYIDGEKQYSNEPELIDAIEYQMILTDKNHVDCKFNAENGTETVLRIYTIPEDTDKTDMIEINGLNVIPNENAALVFMYSGVLPTVKCYGNCTSVETTNSSNTKLICTVKDKKWTLRFYKDHTCAGVFEANERHEQIEPEVIPTSHVEKLNTLMDISRFKCAHNNSIIFQYIIIPGDISDIQTATVSSFIEKHYMKVTGGALLILLILIICAILVYSKRRKRALECDQCAIDYANLPCGLITQLERRQSEPCKESTRLVDPYMSPADVYEEINPYSVPYNAEKETKDKIDEGHYAELNLDDAKEVMRSNWNTESPYAVVSAETKDLYAKVKPKYERNKVNYQ